MYSLYFKCPPTQQMRYPVKAYGAPFRFPPLYAQPHVPKTSEHPDAPAVRTNPSGAVAHAPQIFLHAVVTNLETTRAVPAKRQDPAAGMTSKPARRSPAAAPPLRPRRPVLRSVFVSFDLHETSLRKTPGNRPGATRENVGRETGPHGAGPGPVPIGSFYYIMTVEIGECRRLFRRNTCTVWSSTARSARSLGHGKPLRGLAGDNQGPAVLRRLTETGLSVISWMRVEEETLP